MNLQSVTLRVATGELAQAARTLALEPGSELVARVVATGPEAGRGTIALAGMTLPARLPAQVQAGQTLRLQVVHVDQSQLTVRIQPSRAAAGGVDATLAQAAGRMAVSGDGDLTAAALALAGGRPLWLPDGGAATVAVEADGEAAGGGRGPGGVAAFVLHSPALGAIEVRLTMAGGSVRAGVVTAAGEATGVAREALAELREALARATGRPAAASVSERPRSVAAPAPPVGRVDVQA